MQLPSSGPSGFDWQAVPLSLLSMVGGGGLIAAWLRWSAARSSTPAQQQASLNAAFSGLTADLQEERAWLTARISELERKLAECELTILQKDGEIRGLKQRNASLQRWQVRSGIPPPGEEIDEPE
jgi:hypothetical protein